MKVFLAGYNVDTTVLKELQDKAGKRADVTPEVLSAAYARISRDPRAIQEIRQDARNEVERTRKSNQTIIFKMGHHSVAEHAVFNLDIVGVSRLAMEELEKFRLCSYTEKSQRYITLDKDFVMPQEIHYTRFEKQFKNIIAEQNKAYFELFEKLKAHVFQKHADLAADPKKHNLLEGWAKEDARYVTALATESQAGMTVNARNLELVLRRFASHPLEEVKTLGRAIYEHIAEIAPSVVLFHQANDRDEKTHLQLEELTRRLVKKTKPQGPVKSVELLDYTKNADDIVAASLMHSSCALPYKQCLSLVKKLSKNKKMDIFKTAWQNMQFYDSMFREFEYVNLTYNIVLSSACFGQLKRHRMSTITTQKYDPSLGLTIPENIKEIGMENYFKEIAEKSEAVYEDMKKEKPLIAPYVLLNAHKRRVLMRVNARELYHVARLREDAHAQWDIQNVARSMAQSAKKVMPMTLGLISGKDQYNSVYTKVFNRPPHVTEASLPGVRTIKK